MGFTEMCCIGLPFSPLLMIHPESIYRRGGSPPPVFCYLTAKWYYFSYMTGFLCVYGFFIFSYGYFVVFITFILLALYCIALCSVYVSPWMITKFIVLGGGFFAYREFCLIAKLKENHKSVDIFRLIFRLLFSCSYKIMLFSVYFLFDSLKKNFHRREVIYRLLCSFLTFIFHSILM